MRLRTAAVATRLVILAIVLSIISACGGSSQDSSDERYSFNVGWIDSLASEGQIVETMKRTDVMDLWNIDAEFTGLGVASDNAQAMIGGAVDNHWASEQPITGAIAKGADITMIAQSIGWRTGYAVAKDSDIEVLADLRGKTVGMHLGLSTQYAWEKALRDAGLDPGQDVEIVNVKFTEHESALSTGKVDAVASWDPTLTMLSDARVIQEEVMGSGTDIPGSIIAVDSKMLESERDKVVAFLAAVIESTWYTIQHQDQTNKWFSESSNIPMEALEGTADYEPLWDAESITDIDMKISDAQVSRMQEHADWFYDQKLISDRVKVDEHVDTDLIVEAMKLIKQNDAGDRELTVLKE